MKKKNKHWGSTLDDFLNEEGIKDEAKTAAVTRITAWQRAQKTNKQNRKLPDKKNIEAQLSPFMAFRAVQTLAENRGISIERLCEEVGVKFQTVYRWRTNKDTYNVTIYKKISDHYFQI